ncbi:MAG: serine/threonine protein kinase [Clostridia bacterium]|nr:serine/threonine protein kinase [Clostridia bacterium]
MIGTILDRKYRIIELIGSGGMAQVYKAINMSNRRTVAVKVLKDEYKDDAEFLRRFSREANAILTLSHENIVRAYGAGTHNGMPYLVMEYVEGRTLKDLIAQNGALPVRTAIGITCQILDALSAAHAHGIIHRDVKPQNVIVTDKGRVKLADFGIAREVKASTVTFSGQKVLGSVHYISPEQAKGSITTEQSDLYSAGICLYEMLTGIVPFDADSAVSIALMHIQDKPVPPIELKPELPPALNDIVLKALEKEPENRYQTARAMRSDLVRSLSDPNGTFVGEPEEKKQKIGKKRPSVYVLIAMCVFVPILLIGVFILVYVTSGQTKSASDASEKTLETTQAAETASVSPTGSVPASIDTVQSVPNLVGYSMDDALHLLYYQYGFTNLVVEFTDTAPADTRQNTVVSLSVSDSMQNVLFEVQTPSPSPAADETPQPTPEPETPQPTATPDTGDTETIVAQPTEAPEEDTLSIGETAQPQTQETTSAPSRTPEPSREPDLSVWKFYTNTPVHIRIYRKSRGTCKADISFTLKLDPENTENLVEIGYDTINYEDVPYRIVLHSHVRPGEQSEITETATVYDYDPVTRALYLYVNDEKQPSPQSVTFAK